MSESSPLSILSNIHSFILSLCHSFTLSHIRIQGVRIISTTNPFTCSLTLTLFHTFTRPGCPNLLHYQSCDSFPPTQLHWTWQVLNHPNGEGDAKRYDFDLKYHLIMIPHFSLCWISRPLRLSDGKPNEGGMPHPFTTLHPPRLPPAPQGPPAHLNPQGSPGTFLHPPGFPNAA